MSKAIKFKTSGNEDVYVCPYFPIGYVYISTSNINPGTIFGGTWEQIKDKFLLGAGSSYTSGTTGGAKTHTHTTAGHTLTIAEMPSHTHVNARGVASVSPGSTSTPNTSWANGSTFAWNTTSEATGGGSSHSHGNTGSSSNLPPYLVVYMWKRVS